MTQKMIAEGYRLFARGAQPYLTLDAEGPLVLAGFPPHLEIPCMDDLLQSGM
ncbi:hypothetical protein J4460_08645 [Candidatus Woesearchaeota archaeon]|nr:MAG: hypothetical protein QS99_C0013G0030 [archaeon GW2011_AR4]MBS3130706.1 hypothetical protein [Candidatus Woesearchaeota archaeon]HIH38831.1 hypothetical protein [Candidatus Woesearchaeota archaeon]HIH48901.1 hypothetical protein [Candidatus Woesearchaeota archaeon]HIJ04346.1 hypothetical protein [Candidatus Woesearchaeota archaeon]